VTPSREFDEYRELRDYIDDLVEILGREQRRANATERQEARRLSDAAEERYAIEQRGYDQYVRRMIDGSVPSSIVPSQPEPPPYRWSRIALKLGVEEGAETVEETPAPKRRYSDLAPAEKAQLGRQITSHIKTGTPSQRKMAKDFRVSRHQIDAEIKRRG
jgi:hypothetical protein